MPAVVLVPADLTIFAPDIPEAKALAMIADAIARAAQLAPCILTDDFPEAGANAAKAVIRDAILRWNERGTGAVTSEGSGPFSRVVDTRTSPRTLYWPAEITELQALCTTPAAGGGGSALPIHSMPDPCDVRIW